MADDSDDREQSSQRSTGIVQKWASEFDQWCKPPSFAHLTDEQLLRRAERPGSMCFEEAEAFAAEFKARFKIDLLNLSGKGAPKVPPHDKALDSKAVCELLGVHISTLKRMRENDPAFPKPSRTSPRRVTWRLRDVKAYRDQQQDGQAGRPSKARKR